MPRKFLQSLRHALRGVRTAAREERNFKIRLLIAVVILIATFILHFSAIEFALIVLAIALVLGTELLNTVIEDALDVVEPNHHPIIGKAKDVMAGVVLINACAALLIGIATVVHHMGFTR